MPISAAVESIPATRVLVFAADDGPLCVDINRVDSVCTRSDVQLHTLKTGDAVGRTFLIERGEPALVVDIREALGLTEILGVTDRAAFVVMRAGSLPLALAVDACIGVRDLDLQAKAPVPTALQRDGGFSVGHLIELEGTIHTLLEPSRILSGTLRARLDPLLEEARAFCEREKELASLAQRLRADGPLADLRSYARLARRNGRTRAAAAARAVLKMAQEAEQHVREGDPIAADHPTETLLRDLLALSSSHQTGELLLGPPGCDTNAIFFVSGRIADARTAGLVGRAAFKEIVTLHDGPYRFRPSDVPIRPQRIEGATLWLLVETLEQSAETRRNHQTR